MDERSGALASEVAHAAPFLQGGGETGALIRAHDWAATALGAPESWPQALRTAVALMLASRQPAYVAWGPELVSLYNDGYLPFLGSKHPHALGAPYAEVWPEVLEQMRPVIEALFQGEAIFFEDQPLALAGRDRPLSWFTYSWTPLRDDTGAVAGLYCAAVETTDTVLARDRDAAERDRLARMFEQAPGFMALLSGPEHVFELTNAAYRQLISHRDVVGRPIREALPDLAGQGFYELLDRVRTSGDPFVGREVPITLQPALGAAPEERMLDFIYQPVTDANGTVTGIFVEGTDATERARADAELRASEARFRAIVETARDYAIFTTDAEGWIETWPAGAEAVFGWIAVEAIGHPHDLTFTPEDRTAGVPDEELRTAREKGQAPNVRWHQRRDGSRVFIEGITRPLANPDGTVTGFVKVVQDVTERRAAEERLRELNETLEQRVADALAERQLLADFVESANTSILAFDLDYRILAINKAAAAEMERVYGKRPQVGDNILELLADMPEHQAQVARAWGRALAGEEFMIVEEFGDTARERVTYEARFNVLRDRDGKPVGALQTAFDVSDRVRAQAELEAAQEQLRQSQKMEAMGQLTGGVAHDFNNLLTPIIGSLDRLVTRGVGSERERRLMAGALESAERAKTLVQRLLAFARRQPLQPVAVDLRALVEGMAELIGSTLGPAIEVRVELADDLPPAKADPNQLEMALLNLAVNARDAMPEGGTLTVAASRESVRGRDRVGSGLKQGHYVRLSVSDTGEGMDEATVARAVEPFFSTKGIGRGTGLGLSMVHGLAAQLGGGLTIQSTPGRGTTVELWLPMSAEPIDTADGERVAVPPVATRGRALLVDDEDLVRMSTADMLADLGFDVQEASLAEDALRLLQEGAAVDLLVTDHLMPGMNGAELARTVRQLRPGLPVLVVSGYAEVEGLAPDLPRLVKPFRIADLAEAIAPLMPGEAAMAPGR